MTLAEKLLSVDRARAVSWLRRVHRVCCTTHGEAHQSSLDALKRVAAALAQHPDTQLEAVEVLEHRLQVARRRVLNWTLRWVRLIVLCLLGTSDLVALRAAPRVKLEHAASEQKTARAEQWTQRMAACRLAELRGPMEDLYQSIATSNPQRASLLQGCVRRMLEQTHGAKHNDVSWARWEHAQALLLSHQGQQALDTLQTLRELEEPIVSDREMTACILRANEEANENKRSKQGACCTRCSIQ
eukprot:TRINITY_DN44626_c0_g1_i1.p1 TRINITY_DN44626_c0_g1~~TRINITY_DN44626_c0_g1_i1.p1  ORF type:complete len:243 (+),score=53.01 TRINITY_DN44626_c0_g1_i1:216-944(+)